MKVSNGLVRCWLPMAAISTILPLAGACNSMVPMVWVTETQVLEFSSSDVETFAATTRNGEISVEADPEADSIVVEVEIKASGVDEMDAYATLDLVEVGSRRTGDDDRTLEVLWEWRSKPEWNRSAKVSYRARVPADMVLRLKSHNGDLAIEGPSGSARVETHNGNITVRAPDRSAENGKLFAETHNGRLNVRTPAEEVQLKSYNGRVKVQLLSNGRLGGKITSHNGAIHIGLRPGVDVAISAKTHNGRVSCDLARDLFSERDRSPRRFEGVLGEGSERLAIVTHNGRVEIDEVDDEDSDDDDDEDDDDDDFDIDLDD